MTLTLDRTTTPVPVPVAIAEEGSTTRRRAAGLTFLASAILTMAGILATPWEGGSGTPVYLKSLADHRRQALVAAVLLHFGYLLFVPGCFVMARLVRRGSRKLANVGLGFAVLGSGLSGLLVTDMYDLSIARHLGTTAGSPVSEMKDVPLAPLGFVSIGMLTALGATLGLVILAVGMFRARLAPLWPAIAIFAGFVVGFGAHGMVRATAAFASICVALAFLGITVLRMSDERFEYGSDPR